jgi:gliding motility-associated-like protein
MRQRYILFYILFLLCPALVHSQQPVEFVENQGQWGTWFKYKAATQSGDVLLEKDGFRYVLNDPDNFFKMDYYHHGQTKVKPTLKFHVYKVTFESAKTPVFESERPYSVYYNYFLGSDSSCWKTGIHPSRSVNYRGVYDGIDVQVSSEMGDIVYDFIVAPHADVSKVKLKFEGQDKISLNDGNLVINTSVGHMTEMKPFAFQYVNDERVLVPCEYHLDGTTVSFDFPRGYNKDHKLIIDPIVKFCTMTGSTADNWGFTATYDDAGNFYAGGLVNNFAYAGTSFPVSPGAFQMTFGGGLTYVDPGTGQLWAYAADISIIKYDPTLTSRIYATYLGGAGNDHAHSMVVDASQNLIIDGRTASTNYPVTPGAFQTAYHGKWDIVVTKFNSGGTGLIGSTYIGGNAEDGVNFDSTEYGYGQLKYNYGDDARSEVLLDKLGNIFVAGCTSSPDFPTTASAISSTLSGMQDGVIFKFNSTLTSLLWSTYIGGTGSDAGYVLAFDTSYNSVYVSGGTNSTNFPTTAGTLFPAYQGGTADGFILKFRNGAPYNLLGGTYIGTPGYDQVYGIQVSGGTDQVYVMGQTLGGAFPVTASYSNPGSSQFIMKLNNGLTTNLVSTVFGSSSSTFTNISPTAFLVDTCENIYVSGWGGNLGIPGVPSGECHGMPTTPDAAQATTDGRDFYFIVLAPGLASLKYATYYGRSCTNPFEGEHVDGGTSRFSKQGSIYQGICANCGGVYNPVTNPSACVVPFPTTPGVWSEIDSSRNCNEAALKINFNIGPVQCNITAGPSSYGCAPFTVNFYNTTTNGLTYLWDFGDGSAPVTSYETTHTFTAGGTYTVTLSATNSNACFKTEDTAYLLIVVDTNKLNPDFTFVVTDSCDPFTSDFTNTSTTNITTGAPTYTWFFGDGTTFTGVTPPTHNYPDTGSYTVMLIMAHPDACKTPDTVQKRLDIYYKKVSANFNIPDTICLGVAFIPSGGAVNATTITWYFGDGTQNTDPLPAHIYTAVGTYKVIFVAQNPGACNKADTVEKMITVLSGPIANFKFIPVKPEANIPTTFTNLSFNATRYAWDFGDDTKSTEINPVHQYNKTGNYKVCLTAYNESVCPSVACKTVPTEVVPLLGLPTGFSPNGDGVNDILYVRGAAIKTMDLKIYNRWGQLVFESTQQDVGWDGTFNGQPQPIEAYGYVLNATFIDGTSRLLKGNITLLR